MISFSTALLRCQKNKKYFKLYKHFYITLLHVISPTISCTFTQLENMPQCWETTACKLAWQPNKPKENTSLNRRNNESQLWHWTGHIQCLNSQTPKITNILTLDKITPQLQTLNKDGRFKNFKLQKHLTKWSPFKGNNDAPHIYCVPMCGPTVWAHWAAQTPLTHTKHQDSGFSFSHFETAKLSQHNAAPTNPDPPIQFKRNCVR